MRWDIQIFWKNIKKCKRVPQGHKIHGRRSRRWRSARAQTWDGVNDYEWVVMIIMKLVSWLCFGVGYRIIVWCLLLVGGLVVWTLWWWVAMRCHLIMSIWLNLFQIDSSILTIQNSYALQWRSLKIVVSDWHRVLTDKSMCTPARNRRVDHCESQCLALFTFSRRHVPSRKVEATLCVKDVGHGKRGNCDFISTMGNSG
jgi:hypothetical protein